MKRLSLLLAAIILILSLSSCAMLGQKEKAEEEIISVQQVSVVNGDLVVEYADGYRHSLGDLREAALEYTRLDDGTYEARLVGSPTVTFQPNILGNTTQFKDYTFSSSQNGIVYYWGGYSSSQIQPSTETGSMTYIDLCNTYYATTGNLMVQTESSRSERDFYSRVSPYFGHYDISWLPDKKAEQIEVIVTFDPFENPTRNGLDLYFKTEQYRSDSGYYNSTCTVAFRKDTSYYAYYGSAVYNYLKNNLTEVKFREGITVSRIPSGAFLNCSMLSTVNVPDSVTSIGDAAFANCFALQELTLPSEVTTFGNGILYSSNFLKSIELPTSLLKAFFSRTSGTPTLLNLEKIVINGGTFIPSRALASNFNVKHIEIGDSVQRIEEEAFFDCVYLEDVVIGDGVVSIGESAFSDCISLESVTVGDGIQSIEPNAFYNCLDLRFLSLPSHMNGTYTGDWGMSSSVITYR